MKDSTPNAKKGKTKTKQDGKPLTHPKIVTAHDICKMFSVYPEKIPSLVVDGSVPEPYTITMNVWFCQEFVSENPKGSKLVLRGKDADDIYYKTE